MPRSDARSERVDLRMTPHAKRTLMRAASAANKTLTEFLLDSGMSAAFEALADRRTFVLDDEQWRAFNAELEKTPADNPALRHLLLRKPTWKK